MCKWLRWNHGRYSSLGSVFAWLSLYWAGSVLPLPSSSARVTQWLRDNCFPKLFHWLVHPWIPKQQLPTIIIMSVVNWTVSGVLDKSRNQRTTGSVVAALDEVWCYRGKWNKPRIHCDHERRPFQWCLSNKKKMNWTWTADFDTAMPCVRKSDKPYDITCRILLTILF